MSDNIPKLRKHSNRRNINILIDQDVDEIYRSAKQNGHDSSELARRAVSDLFRKLAPKLKQPAS